MTAIFEVAVSAVMTVAVIACAAFAGYGWHRIIARYTRRSSVTEYARAGRVRNPR